MLEIHPEHTRVDPEEQPTIFPVGFWLAVFVAALVGSFLVSGCATETKTQVCYLRIMGTTEQGYTVVMQACQSPEQFAESQR